MSADELDTAALREKFALYGYATPPPGSLDHYFYAALDEIDRLRAALAFHVGNIDYPHTWTDAWKPESDQETLADRIFRLEGRVHQAGIELRRVSSMLSKLSTDLAGAYIEIRTNAEEQSG